MDIELQFGRAVTTESYFDGKLKGRKIEYSIPEKAFDKSEVLNEVLKALEIINNGTTDKMTIIVEKDRVTKHYKLVTRQYEVLRSVNNE